MKWFKFNKGVEIKNHVYFIKLLSSSHFSGWFPIKLCKNELDNDELIDVKM